MENDILRLQCYDALTESVRSTAPRVRDQDVADPTDRLGELEAEKALQWPPSFSSWHPVILQFNAAIQRGRDQRAAERAQSR